MIDIKNKSMCVGCNACKNICPRNAINMIEDEEGFLYPKVNREFCSNCGLCETVCPILNIKEEDKTLPKTYAAYNKDDNIRMKSSSGGIFTEIAKLIIKKGGIVFGAVFNQEFNVVHEGINTEKGLEKIRGAKYIQSNIGDSYKKVKQYLENGIQVLFTGTPCQIEGLYSFLKKDYKNLYTQDLICHGVPSKNVWKKYLEYRQKIDNGILEKINFRNKENKGWSHYEVSFKYINKVVNINHNKDLYMKLFLKDMILRPSCYDCRFKKRHKKSDITLADFWGINNVLEKINDEKGISLVIVNSEKGDKLLSGIANEIKYELVDFEAAIKDNRSMIKSADINNRTEDYIYNCNFEEFDKMFAKD